MLSLSLSHTHIHIYLCMCIYACAYTQIQASTPQKTIDPWNPAEQYASIQRNKEQRRRRPRPPMLPKFSNTPEEEEMHALLVAQVDRV